MFVKINPHLFLLLGSKGGRFPYANSLLVKDEVNALIDTGANPADLERVAQESPPDLVVNTHFHIDHSRGNRFFPQTRIIAHRWEAGALASKEAFLAASGLAPEVGEEYYRNRWPVWPVEGTLQGGDLLDFGATKLRVLHTPGHTPGHLALFHEEEEILFAGDIDLTSFGPWYGNPEANIEDFRRSIMAVRDLRPRLVLTGHLEPVTEGIRERFDQFLEVLDRRDEVLLQFLKEPKTMEEIVDAKLIYRKHPEPEAVFRHFEQAMVTKHLDGLERAGLVRKEGEVYLAP